MKISVDWLQDYIDKTLSTQEMAEALELAGVEVEGVEKAAGFDDGIVVGKVIAVRPHPNADKLRLADVRHGKNVAHVVCGAPNLQEGQTVALAQVGATLPDGTALKAAVIRGEESQGMICSEQELGISDSHAGIMVLPDEWESGRTLSHYLQQKDIIEVKTHPNRWDLQSVMGLSREIAAQTDSKLKYKAAQLPEKPAAKPIKVAKATRTKRYMLARVKLSGKGDSPAWMVSRLRASNVRPISLVVDITNYVMLKTGQPLHAFDAAKTTGPVSVRFAAKAEKLKTLDGVVRILHDQDVVIAGGEDAIGLAGVMGGEETEISGETTEILLEAATFDGGLLRKTAHRYGLRTDASARFERRLPVEAAAEGLARAISLLEDLAGASVVELADTVVEPGERRKLTVQPEKVGGLLGVTVTAKSLQDHLPKLGFGVKALPASEVDIEVPWWRPDISMTADISEEMIKLMGYDSLPATIPPLAVTGIAFDKTWAPLWKAKSALRSAGLFEVVTYSFISEDQVRDADLELSDHLKLKNPLSSEQAYLRTALLPSLLETAVQNRNYAKTFGLYEFSKVYEKQGEGEQPHEPMQLGVLVRRPAGAHQYAKGVLDRLANAFNVGLTFKPGGGSSRFHPARAAKILLDGKEVGLIGQLHPGWVQDKKLDGEIGYISLSWEPFANAAEPKRPESPSRFPHIIRDISLLADRSVLWQDLESKIKLDPPLQSAQFIGDYYGSDLPKGKKSVTLRLTFGSNERTLTDAEADKSLQGVISLLTKTHGIELRD